MKILKEYYQRKYFKKAFEKKINFSIPVTIKQFEKIFIVYDNNSSVKKFIPYVKSYLEKNTKIPVQLIEPSFSKEQIGFWGFPKEKFYRKYIIDQKLLVFDFAPDNIFCRFLYSLWKNAFIVTISIGASTEHSNITLRITENAKNDEIKNLLSQIFSY